MAIKQLKKENAVIDCLQSVGFEFMSSHAIDKTNKFKIFKNTKILSRYRWHREGEHEEFGVPLEKALDWDVLYASVNYSVFNLIW